MVGIRSPLSVFIQTQSMNVLKPKAEIKRFIIYALSLCHRKLENSNDFEYNMYP